MAATENVTVLFTDLVGSTELASALTQEAGDELRLRHFSILRQVILASGDKRVKNLGDGLMVDDYFGDTVVEATRLCTRAEGGQILIADLVRASAGRRSPHAFSSLGELELKDLPEPVETLEVGWEPLGEVVAETSTVPLPARLEIVPIAGVVARDTEVSLLVDAFKRVMASEGREVVLVSGEAGLGKTTLVAEAARRNAEAGAIVLLGRCQEDLEVSYAAFVEALHHYVSHAREDVLTAHLATHDGELARMVPALGQRLGEIPAPTSTDPDTERYLLYGAVVGLLTLASSSQPLVLVLDDLKWSDKPTLQLLRHIVANVESDRLLVLGTLRDSELSGSHPLTEVLGALRRESKVSRTELKGFDDTGVLTFMEAAPGHRLEGDGVRLAHALHRESHRVRRGGHRAARQRTGAAALHLARALSRAGALRNHGYEFVRTLRGHRALEPDLITRVRTRDHRGS